jgi:hypothetical protein
VSSACSRDAVACGLRPAAVWATHIAMASGMRTETSGRWTSYR